MWIFFSKYSPPSIVIVDVFPSADSTSCWSKIMFMSYHQCTDSLGDYVVVEVHISFLFAVWLIFFRTLSFLLFTSWIFFYFFIFLLMLNSVLWAYLECQCSNSWIVLWFLWCSDFRPSLVLSTWVMPVKHYPIPSELPVRW